ncbi:hypothetical protein PIB30_045416 [Stylosanthes scabra]|uniref:Transposase MuDR plant domain-containing protein n=1 Tax=Stylosanthes scabra TaxID=79078 RepID=A0ABU6ZEZ8_9FABA|nr:hypothetical protein [Stylosanthes scabra]
MVLFNITLYHKGHFAYVDGDMRYVGGEKLDPTIEDYSIGLGMFLNDEDALEMRRIAAKRGACGAVYGASRWANEEGGVDEAPPNGQNEDGGVDEAPSNRQNEEPIVEVAAPIDQGEALAGDEAAPIYEDECADLNTEGEAESNVEADLNAEGGCADGEEAIGEVNAGMEEQGHEWEGDVAGGFENEDTDIDDEEYVPSADEVDSADDVHFTDSEEELDFDDNFFGLQTDAGENGGDRKGKRVVNEEFSDEGEDSNELEDGHAVGDISDEDRTVFPVHKPQENMAEYRWQVGTVYASRKEFKDAVTANAVYTKRGVKFDKVDPKRVIVNY